MSDETNIDAIVEALTDQQRTVLQAIYNHFREHAAWPKFITIDRPIRRERKWDTAAIVQGLPESVIVPPRHGNLRPVSDDELRLRLPGIEACDGGPEDTARFARLLRWIAEREEAYEPPADSTETMPLVTSAEAAQYLGLGVEDDRLPLLRLLALFRLDHWSAGTGGPDDSGDWTVRPGEDIWRFHDVQTVQDVVDAREAWVAEGRPKVLVVQPSTESPYYHVRLSAKTDPSSLTRFDLSRDELGAQFLAPYGEGRDIVTNGRAMRLADVTEIRVVQTDKPLAMLHAPRGSLLGQVMTSAFTDWGRAVGNGTDVTGDLITAPPGHAFSAATVPLPAAVAVAYIDQQVIDAIRAKDGQSRFNVTKLLTLIDELNDNFAHKNTYGSHALLRGLLDHIPPILGFKSFDQVASNYAWSKTDTKYMKQLANFRAQGDDALHRPISADADLLGFDDMPTSVCVDRLLLECAKKL